MSVPATMRAPARIVPSPPSVTSRSHSWTRATSFGSGVQPMPGSDLLAVDEHDLEALLVEAHLEVAEALADRGAAGAADDRDAADRFPAVLRGLTG